MTAANQFDDLWRSLLPTPYPLQDTDLLKQVGFLPGLREVLMTRQVHALEHATVWILTAGFGNPIPEVNFEQSWTETGSLGGLSTERGFYLYGQVQPTQIRRAAQEALQRMTQGEWELAVHPRCGTNVSVGMMLTAGLALGTHLILPRGPIEQLLGLGFAVQTAAQWTPEVGRLMQQYVTTSIPFNLRIQDVTIAQDAWGRPAHFIHTEWIDSVD